MIQRLHLQAMRIFDETGMELKLDFTDGLLSIFTRRLVETFKPTKFKKGVRHKMNIKTIILNIRINRIGK